VSAPANRPDYRVTVDGQDITPVLRGDGTGGGRPRLVALRLSERRGDEADQLELTVDDSDGQVAIPPEGATITLQLGWASGAGVTVGLVDKGSYVVDEVEHGGPPDALVIRARSADLAGSLRTRREHAWHDTSLGEVVRALAGRNGLRARVDPTLAGIAVKVLVQTRESDMALLRRLGREHDALATVKAKTLLFAPIGAGKTAGGATIPAVTIARGDGDRHSYRVEKRDAAGKVEAAWHDRGKAKRQLVTVGDGDGAAKRLARVYPTEAAARAAAEAERKRCGRTPRRLELSLALGRLDLYPERAATVRGFKRAIDETRWVVSEVTHELGARGFGTSVACEVAS